MDHSTIHDHLFKSEKKARECRRHTKLKCTMQRNAQCANNAAGRGTCTRTPQEYVRVYPCEQLTDGNIRCMLAVPHRISQLQNCDTVPRDVRSKHPCLSLIIKVGSIGCGSHPKRQVSALHRA